jgi:hypothetical protein
MVLIAMGAGAGITSAANPTSLGIYATLMVVYCGIPTTQQSFLNVARTASAPLLVSANAFWKNDRFSGYEVLWDIEVPLALDCGGFVAMKRYGGYRWSMLDYIDLAVMLRPVWWAAQDYSCEPEIAANSAEIGRRIRNTVFTLAETLARVIHWNQELPGLPATAPMPVIQGWRPTDYTTCVKLMEDHVISDPVAARILGSNQWPALVGVGSLCRRNLTGPNNLYQIIDALDGVLPPHVGLHLFGIKSTAVARLKDRARIVSVDSMAWNYAARREAFVNRVPKTKELLCDKMSAWIVRQRKMAKPSAQMALF